MFRGVDEDTDHATATRANFQTALPSTFYDRDPCAQNKCCKPCRAGWIKMLMWYDSIFVKLSQQKRSMQSSKSHVAAMHKVEDEELPDETLFRTDDSSLVDRVFIDTDDFIPIVIETPPQITATIKWSIHTEYVVASSPHIARTFCQMPHASPPHSISLNHRLQAFHHYGLRSAWRRCSELERGTGHGAPSTADRLESKPDDEIAHRTTRTR